MSRRTCDKILDNDPLCSSLFASVAVYTEHCRRQILLLSVFGKVYTDTRANTSQSLTPRLSKRKELEELSFAKKKQRSDRQSLQVHSDVRYLCRLQRPTVNNGVNSTDDHGCCCCCCIPDQHAHRPVSAVWHHKACLSTRCKPFTAHAAGDNKQ